MAIILKNQEQIEGIRKSSQLAAKTLNYIEPFVKAGVSTEYLDDLISEFVKQHGAISATLNYNGYPKSCCISPNNVICHGIPNKETILKDGDIVNIDVTTILNGYFGDTSRMYAVGEISKEASDLIETTKHCLNLGIKEVRPDNQFGNIGFAISRYAQSKGYSVVYEFCGHGVGLQFHEDPQVDHIARKNSGPSMKAGMIFTIEPMINAGRAKVEVDKNDGWTARTVDKKLSAQFEHTVLVTPDGVEILTEANPEN
jgi:methionyl aminopeptidase